MYPIGVILYSWLVANKNQAAEGNSWGGSWEKKGEGARGSSDEIVRACTKKILSFSFFLAGVCSSVFSEWHETFARIRHEKNTRASFPNPACSLSLSLSRRYY